VQPFRPYQSEKVGNVLAAFCHAKKRVLATMLSGETDLK
jgi:hypothetical protein